MDARVERLDPPVEHLREARDGRDVGHRQARVAQRPRRAAGRDELEAEARRGRVRARPGPSCPRRTGAPGAARGSARRPGRVDVDPARRPVDRERAREEQRDDPRQQPMLDRLDPCAERGLVVAGQDRDGLLGDDRARRRGVASTRWTVTPVTATPVGERVADGVGARERRQQRRMGVEDAARERGEDAPARRGACSRPGRRRRRRAPASASRRAARRRRPGRAPCRSPARRPVERRAGRSAKTSDDLAAELAAALPPRAAPAGSIPAPDTPTAIRPATGRRLTRPPRAAPRRSASPPSSSAATTSPDEPARRRRRRRGSSIAVAYRVGGHDDDHPEAAVERRAQLVVVEPAEGARRAA